MIENGKQPPVGIDLGTTYSVVAYLDPSGRPLTVANSTGDLLTPSALLFDDDGIAIGKEAVKGCALSPDRYIDCFKRDMGSDKVRRTIRGIEVPPEVLSGLVLQRLKEDAERRLGPIRQVVITVPAFFDETRRQATQQAGALAGLEVLDIINEPTAAALAFGHQFGFLRDATSSARQEATRVLVYDLGGGTFDVTILEINGPRFRTLATDGDVCLGGKDFDERLVGYLAERFIEAHGIDPRRDPQDAAQLWLDAQEAKHTLSERSKATVVCYHSGLRMRIEVTREQFDDLIRDLVERTETTTSLVIKQAGLTWQQIDRILLVGGSSRVPMVNEMLRKVTGKEPDRSQSADEAVAHGAALYAGMLMSHNLSAGQKSCELINVNSHSLGVVGLHPETRQDVNVVLIPKNTPLPCRAMRTFKTAKADQRSVRVRIVEGESPRPDACIALGECIVRDLPAGLPKHTPVEVEYSYHNNGRLSVSARVPTVRYSEQVEIARYINRVSGDLASWRARLCGGTLSHVTNSNPGSPDATNVLIRLDQLYHELGLSAIEQTLPENLQASQQNALAVTRSLAQTRAKLVVAEQLRSQHRDSENPIHLDAQVTQAKLELQQAEVQANFSLLVLGRECMKSNVPLPQSAGVIAEIKRLTSS